jgi:hypothetical protein
MLAKEKILSISICDQTILKIWCAKKTTIGNMTSCFFPPLKKVLNFLGIHLVMFKNQHFPTSYVVHSLVLGVCSKISKLKCAFVI